MALYTLNMENMATLNPDQKSVQVTDMVNVHGDILSELLTRITELEGEVARMGAAMDDDKTQAMDSGDVANMADVEDEPGTPKKPMTPKKKAPKKTEKKAPKKEKVSYQELSMQGFDPTKCRRRLYADGWGCQCQKDIFEAGLCKADYNALYGEKKKAAWAEKETFEHGYADEPRPDENLIKGGRHRWRGADGEFPEKVKKAKKSPVEKVAGEKKMKAPSVADIRAEIAEIAPDKDLTGMKKKELVLLLESLKNPEVKEDVPQEAVPPPQEDVPKEDVPQEDVPQEAVPQEAADLEEEIGDDLDGYDDIEYQGVEYLVKGDQLFNADFELIGTWDTGNRVANITNTEALEKHAEEMDTDDE